MQWHEAARGGPSPVHPPGLHGPGQLPGRARVLQLPLGCICQGLGVPSFIFLLLQGPPGQRLRSPVPKGGGTGQLIQYGGQCPAWEDNRGWKTRCPAQPPPSALRV